MNQNTWVSWITTGIGLIGSAAVTKGAIDQSTADAVGGLAGMAVPLVWGWFIHRDSKVVQTASAVQGIAPIQVESDAAPEIRKMAMDPTIPSVVVVPPPALPSSLQRR